MRKEKLEDLGLRMKNLRFKQRYTARKLAESLGINSNYVFQLESGRRTPSMDLFFRIASVYELTPLEFMEKLYDPTNKSKR